MRISEVMSRAVATIEASESAHAAVVRMLAKEIWHLPSATSSWSLREDRERVRRRSPEGRDL